MSTIPLVGPAPAPSAAPSTPSALPPTSLTRPSPLRLCLLLRLVRGLAVDSHLLEAKVRNAILGQLLAQGEEVVGAKEILDLAEAFAWTTNPGQDHG